MTKPPLLLGHRGCRGRRSGPAENSLPAFEYALAQGCDGFEFDVRHTLDGRNVLCHDPEWHGIEIASARYAELVDRDGACVPTLEEVLERFGESAYLDIELKVPGGEQAVVAALGTRPPQRGFMVSSFHPEILANLSALDPSLSLGFLCDRDKAMAVWRQMPVGAVLPHDSYVTRSLVEEAHASGQQVMTWTVNDARRMHELAEWGIDGIISDNPKLLYQTFHSE